MHLGLRFLFLAGTGLSVIVCVLFHTAQPALTMPSIAAFEAASLPQHASQVRVQDIAQQLTPKVDFKRHFQDLGIEGSILIYDVVGDRTYQHNPQRNATAFPPASSFKILNSLIALETGAIRDELAILTWDGIPRTLPQWNRDLNLKEALRLSAVWFYQVLVRRVGYESMQSWVSKVGYGNQKIGTPAEVDSFWLDGDLRITPQAQMQFLRRFYQNELPFSERSISIVKDIMILEKTPDYTLRGKTGWFGFGSDVQPQIGWYVGYLERADKAYLFVTNIDIRDLKKDPAARLEVTRRCLKDLALLSASP